MRKVLCYILFITFVILPLNVFARSYSLKDMSVSVDDSKWYVFTRDNILNNSELDELGITYDYINSFMNTNDVYLDACQFDTDNNDNTIEMFIVIKKVNNVSNLHTYSDSEINELGKELKNKTGADKFEVYTVGKNKYVHLSYYDGSTSFNIDEYYTVINGNGYTIMSQKKNPFSDGEIAELRSIVDATSFKYDSTYEKNSSSSSIWEKALVTALVVIIINGLTALFNKNKKKDKNSPLLNKDDETNNEDTDDTEEDYVCDNCGTKVKKENTECSKCGLSFNDEEIESIKDSEIEEDKNKDDGNYTSICSNCGAKVKEKDTKCPECGENFEGDEEEETYNNETNMDQKFSDLNKLKKLLDDEIITKEEFEKEKKKILK